MDSVKEYVELVKAPWGKMFYDLLFIQLDVPTSPKLKILDFGSGLGVTANHFAERHDVTAVEPNEEMIANSYRENRYTQIHGGIEKINSYGDNTFDFIFCHNVLEYIEDKEPIVSELLRVLKPGGTLSVVKHNRVGRVFSIAVFKNDPQKAIMQLDESANDKSNYLGTQYIYSNNDLNALINQYGGKIYKTLGLRVFYALGQDNTVKYTNEWYQNMLTLEDKTSIIDDYKNAAFFNHVFIKKETDEERQARVYPIVLNEYNPAWSEWYAEEKTNLERLLGDSIVRIQHIGSTAVPGLTAKPTVDILLEVPIGTDFDEIVAVFSPHPEYICLYPPTNPEPLCVIKGYTDTGFAEKVFHVHVREAANYDEPVFRDYLIAHPEAADEYAALKRTLSQNYEHDRDGYTNAKGAFVKRIVGQAKEEKSV